MARPTKPIGRSVVKDPGQMNFNTGMNATEGVNGNEGVDEDEDEGEDEREVKDHDVVSPFVFMEIATLLAGVADF